MHVTRRVLIEFLVSAKDNDGDIDRTKNGQLVRLLEQSTFSLEECPVMEKVSIIIRNTLNI